jgi:hypothetical protein
MPQLKNHAIGDVNASFARIKSPCVSREAPAPPSNGRIITSVLAVDE